MVQMTIERSSLMGGHYFPPTNARGKQKRKDIVKGYRGASEGLMINLRFNVFASSFWRFSGFKREERITCPSYFHPIVSFNRTRSPWPQSNAIIAAKKKSTLCPMFFPPFENHMCAHSPANSETRYPNHLVTGCRNVYKGWATINRPCKTPRYTRPNTRQDLDLFSCPKRRLLVRPCF